MDILLATINARHAHSSLALRWLRANLGELMPRSALMEFVLGARTELMAERLLSQRPRIVAFSVYVWNVEETTRLVAMLRRLEPGLAIVLGGPEVSHELDEQRIVGLADHVITGPGERAFARLCHQLLDGPRPLQKVIAGDAGDPDELTPPYALYDAQDIAHRILYVEASRGCPFKCEFCLSSLDRTAVPFDTQGFLDQMDALHRRGARQFKFIDRTFNLKASTSAAILDFFLTRLHRTPDDPVFAHFELVPDHLPQALRAQIKRFPAGTLQFEIGIQTWNPEVQALISRRQDNTRAEQNLRWLREHTQAHLHVDLIAGLPGEDLDSFGRGFDRLVALGPHEIQVGILKRLRGTPIIRHTQAFDLRFNPEPPYNVLSTDRIGFADMQRIARFARYWDLIANSGRFPALTRRVLGQSPFTRFMALSDWLWANTDATWRFSPQRLERLLRDWLTMGAGEPEAEIDAAARSDAAHRGDPVPRADPAGLSDAAQRSDRRQPARDGRTTAPDPNRATPPRQSRFLGSDPPVSGA